MSIEHSPSFELAGVLEAAVRRLLRHPPRAAVAFPLIEPFSLNHATRNVAPASRVGRGVRRSRVKTPDYKAWRARQCLAIMAAGPRLRVAGPVEVLLSIPKARCDIDNAVKAYLDAAVEMRLMDDDRNVVGCAEVWSAHGDGLGLILPVPLPLDRRSSCASPRLAS